MAKKNQRTRFLTCFKVTLSKSFDEPGAGTDIIIILKFLFIQASDDTNKQWQHDFDKIRIIKEYAKKLYKINNRVIVCF